MNQDRRSPGIPQPDARERAARDVAGPASPMRRAVARSLVAWLALGWGAALAQPARGRMSPDDREQLRRDLRQQPGRGRRDDGANGQRERASPQQRERMSPQQREQLRRQLREAHDSGRGRGRGRD